MHERLIERWLDSASERSYQAAFCQMLVGKGYIVLHSTRHAPIEFGKDVIAIAPDGVLCAYQLKGNPGSRLTLEQYRSIQAQLFQLATQKIVLPGAPDATCHRSYLVTNGQVDEEVHRAIDDLNRSFERLPGAKIEILARGELLADALALGSALWPAELKDLNILLQLLVETGDGMLPIPRLHSLLASVLLLRSDDAVAVSKEDMRRRLTSAAVLTSVAIGSFAGKDNHVAIINAWVLYYMYVVAACERYALNVERDAGKILKLAADAVLDGLGALCDELGERRHYAEGDVVADIIVYRARLTMLFGLMSVYWIWATECRGLSDAHGEFLTTFIPRDLGKSQLWGEAAIPQVLAHLWYLRQSEGTSKPDLLLAHVLEVVVKSNRAKTSALPGPYFELEDVCRHLLAPLLGESNDPLRDFSFSGRSTYAHSLFLLLVQTNLKVHCRDIWPALSRLAHEEFVPAETWQFCVWRTPDGVEESKVPPRTYRWSDAVAQARDVAATHVPEWLHRSENRHMLLLYLFACPHRGLGEVVRLLGWRRPALSA